jgi:hypothetical protein
MSQSQLVARQRSKYRLKGIDSHHEYPPIAPNHLEELQVDRRDQVWAMDAT